MAEQRTPSNWDDYRKAWAAFGQTMDFLKKEGGVNKENTDAAVKTALASVESVLRKEAEKYAPVKEKTASKRKGTTDPKSKKGIIARLRKVSERVGLPGKGHGIPFSPGSLPNVGGNEKFYAELHTALTEFEKLANPTRKSLFVLIRDNIRRVYLTAAQWELVCDASDGKDGREAHIPPKDGVKNGNGVADASRPKATNPAKSGVTASKERTAKAVAKAVAKPDEPKAPVGPKTTTKSNGTFTVMKKTAKERRAERAAKKAAERAAAKRAG